MGKTYRAQKHKLRNPFKSFKKKRNAERKLLKDLQHGDVDAAEAVFEDDDKKGQGDINI